MGLFSNDITGIDIGAGSIKVVRIAPGKQPKLLSAAIVELPLEAEAASVTGADLRSLATAGKVGRGNIVTLMSGKDLTIRSLTLPKMPMSELNEAVRWESKRYISYSVDNAQIAYLIVGEKNEAAVEKYEIVMVAAEWEKVLGRLAPFTEAKIKVSAVDANALALRNVLRLRGKPGDVNVLVVDIGAGKTEINIFKGGALRFSRCLESGGLDMTRSVSDSLGIGLPEAEERKRSLSLSIPPDEDQAVAVVLSRLDLLLMEIRRSVEYYKTTFRETGVERSILTGGTALMQGIGEYFGRSLAVTVELDQPFSGLTGKGAVLEEFGPIAPRFSAAVGLALREA
jgi:type IV pilus assembly protein PilM